MANPTNQTTNNRKRLEIAFRRWVREEAPSKFFNEILGKDSKPLYQSALKNEEIDHIVPLSLFDLASPEQVRLTWSLDNVRPMEHKENKAKGASIESAYLTLLVSTPKKPEDYSDLMLMVQPDFARLYPGIDISVRDPRGK